MLKAICLAVAVAIPGLAVALPPVALPSPAAVIAARQEGFKAMGGAMKSLKAQLQSDGPARDGVAGAARTLAAAAHEQGALFPPGSGPAPGVKTDALPAIWADRAAFDGLMTKLVVEADRLVAVSDGGDPAAIRLQVEATGAACGACHRQFRADS